MYNPEHYFFDGFCCNDGTIDFYLRIRSVLSHDSKVLDLGAGRAGWFEDDISISRKNIRMLKGSVQEIVACDIDIEVLQNKAADRVVVVSSMHKLPFSANSFDLIICDYVLEHVQNPDFFCNEINRVLKPNGYFFARTPHLYSVLGFALKLVRKKDVISLLKYIQPDRKPKDVFGTSYKLNTLKVLAKHFDSYYDCSYTQRCNPAYFFSNSIVYRILRALSTCLPASIFGNIIVIKRKFPND